MTIQNRQFISSNINLVAEIVTIENVNKYKAVIDSIKYICKYSGYDPGEINLVNEITKPSLPENGKIENNFIYGIYENKSNDAVGWIQYYNELDNKPIVFLGELYVRKEYQNKGYGKSILKHFENIWKENCIEKAVLNVDLKNWDGIRFWVKNGYNQIDKVIGRDSYSENTYNMLRLFKYIE